MVIHILDLSKIRTNTYFYVYLLLNMCLDTYFYEDEIKCSLKIVNCEKRDREIEEFKKNYEVGRKMKGELTNSI